MNKIALKGMKFYAYHGYYEEEQIMGAYFMLDVTVQVDFTKASLNDELADTVNYENIYEVCREIMAVPSKLLEHVAQQIEVRLIQYYPSIQGVNIVLEKLSPPLGGTVRASQISIENQYQKSCSRCQNPFLCHENSACWCHSFSVSEPVSASLKRDFKGCLCEECLSEYGKKEHK